MVAVRAVTASENRRSRVRIHPVTMAVLVALAGTALATLVVAQQAIASAW